MHHKLDIHPIPESVHFVNELDIASTTQYSSQKQYEEALTGKTISSGGVLPDDNIRIYVPIDISADSIMRKLREIYDMLGLPDDKNEPYFEQEFGKLLSQLEIYDQIWAVRDLRHSVRKVNGGVYHSANGIELAEKVIRFLKENAGKAKCFPFEQIDELSSEFWMTE